MPPCWTNRYRGTIYRSDLDSDNPYNTYRHVGLPPGPIANPGLAVDSRGARTPPIPTALYFVLRPDGSGGHQFSNSIADHEAAVARYRRGLQRRKPVKQQLREYLAAERPPAITGAVWSELLARLAPVSESYLRDLLQRHRAALRTAVGRASASTPSRSWSSRWAKCWRPIKRASSAGDGRRARYCRRQVIAAKDRARFLARSAKISAEKQATEGGDGGLDAGLAGVSRGFPGAWVVARKKALGGAGI